MPKGLRVTEIERIVVDVPFTPRCQEWNAREIEQWRIDSSALASSTCDPARPIQSGCSPMVKTVLSACCAPRAITRIDRGGPSAGA